MQHTFLLSTNDFIGLVCHGPVLVKYVFMAHIYNLSVDGMPPISFQTGWMTWHLGHIYNLSVDDLPPISYLTGRMTKLAPGTHMQSECG